MSIAATAQSRPALPSFGMPMLAGAVLVAGGAWMIAARGAELSAHPILVPVIVASGVLLLFQNRFPPGVAIIGMILPYAALPGLLALIGETAGAVSGATWLALIGCWLAAIVGVSYLAELRARAPAAGRFRDLIVAGLFGLWIILVWEAVVVGFKVPFVLLPPPSAIWERLINSVPILWIDFRQTFLKAVLAGYAIGCASGFVVAIIADRIPFMKRGLLPVGNLVSALPLIGVAPIMVMWFGFDWHSKAAVVAVMTFFPMLVNTVAGLSASESMDRDLMHTYAASYGQALLKLRLPAALPFIFNALKINSTLAMIGAIVAEFFGTPIVGMGFRISTEVGRMNIDMVWAEIAVAAVAGSAFYGVIALIERATTFWHPSFRT